MSKKTIRALYIDVLKETVTEITLKDGGAFAELYPLLALEGYRPCEDINIVRVDRKNHYIYVDGEGLLKDPDRFFLYKGYAQPLAGHGLVVRFDDEGETIDCELDPAKVAKLVKFVRLKMHGFVRKTEAATIWGKPGIRYTNIPVFTERRVPGTGEPLDMEKIAKHLGVPVEALQWSVIDSEADLETEPKEEEGNGGP